MNIFFNRKNLVGALFLFLVFAFAAIFVYDLSPANSNAATVVFEIKSGDGFRGTVANLRDARLIRSSSATELYLLISGHALELKPGLYRLSASEWAPTIARTIA